jgi:hypothetical protein
MNSINLGLVVLSMEEVICMDYFRCPQHFDCKTCGWVCVELPELTLCEEEEWRKWVDFD